MNTALLIAVSATLALVATALVTPLVRGAAIGMGLVRQARADRWHTRPTPAVGGVAIFAGFLLGIGAAFVLEPSLSRTLREGGGADGLIAWSTWDGLLAAATAAFLLGLADDFLQLSPVAKLVGQVGAATILLLSGIALRLTGIWPVDAGISLVWFVGITNAVNLLDNMDGLAAGVCAVAGGYLSLIFVLDGQLPLALLSLALTGSILGFLVHNYPPARIFMGDSGSLFLGLFLAGLALSPGEGLSRSLLAVMAVPALILAIPILDTTVVTLGRVLEGRSVARGGRDHTSHRLVDLGLPEERAVWVLWGLAAVGGGVGVLFRTSERTTAALLGGLILVLLVLAGSYFLWVRFRSLRREEASAERGGGVPLYRAALGLHGRYPVLPLVLDALLVVLAYYGAYLIRWSPAELPAELGYFQESVWVVVAAKLAAFVAAGLYQSRWMHFSLADGYRVVRAALLGTLVAALVLLLLEREGLSRGVIIIDLLLTTLLLMGSRLSFRLIEGATQRLSLEGTPVVILGPMEKVGLVRRALAAQEEPKLRPLAVADPEESTLRSLVSGVPLYGGGNALANALHDTGATGVVVLFDGGGGTEIRALARLREHLAERGAVDVYRLEVRVERLREGLSDAASSQHLQRL